jgi:uncharacterized SAM-binding protein YcdF (DUF218 family)
MFFYLAKVFWFFAQPSGLLLVLMIAGAALLRAGREKAGRRLLAASVGLLLIGGLLPASNWLMLPLEQRFARADLAGRDVDGIVVLGGAEDSRIWAGRDAHALNEAGERFTEAMALARRYPKARIAFTGGSIEILSAPTVGADAARTIFRDLGLADGDRLLLESKARDTWENAVLTKALVQPKAGERWLLVTSAWHMPRSMGVFRKAGFDVEPWPVDYRTADAWDLLRLFDAPADGLKRLDTAVREWIGLASYRVTGRSDALFPGP